MLGIGLAILAGSLWAAASSMIAKSARRVDATMLTFFSLVPAVAVMVLAVAVTGEVASITSVGTVELMYLAAAGIAQYSLARVFFFKSLREVGLARTIPLANLSVLVAPLGAVFLVRESANLKLAVGLTLVFVGTVLLTRRSGKQ